jgi:biopolymer transport protein ExbB/TolQ
MMINLDILVSFFYFFLFIVVIAWIFKRSLPTIEAADEADRKNYKQLVAHRANLKKDLDKEHAQLYRQKFLQEHLSSAIQRWKVVVESEQNQQKEEQNVRYETLLRKQEEKMVILAKKQFKKKVLPEIFLKARQQLIEQFHQNSEAKNLYNNQALQMLQDE